MKPTLIFQKPMCGTRILAIVSISLARLPQQQGSEMRRSFVLFRRPGCLLVLGMLAALVVGLSILWDAVRPRCTDTVLDRLPSPDGSWVAVIDEDTCDVGLLAMTDITAGVHLLTTKPPLRDIDVLGVDTGGNDSERPRVAWSAPNVLRVTVFQYAILKVLTRQAEGIQVDVHFDPVDPAARAIWLEQHGLPPDQLDDNAKR